jgi:hypothetical protein
MIKQTFTQFRNAILNEVISHEGIVRALVIHSKDFLTKTPDKKEQIFIDHPEKLIRQQIFPYKKATSTITESKPLITMEFNDFRKRNKNYVSGVVRMYVICPDNLEQTDEGSRYDYVVDQLEEVFSETGIGEFEYGARSDVNIKDGYLGHCLVLKIIDFHIG